MSLDKSVENITEADLVSLIEAGTPELKTLEYKEALPEHSAGAAKEFLADASSFANAAGGHLIYGMRAASGVATELVGLQAEGDPTISRLENMIRDGTAPRIPGLHSFAVKLANSKIAVVIRIPKSFASPHMVKFQGTSRFYSRTSNGKYQLDVQELRAAFLGSETTGERIRDFRFDRLASVRARETSIPLRAGPFAALHIIPINAFGANERHDVIALANSEIHRTLAPLFCDFVNNSRINFDGLLVYQHLAHENTAPGYTQLYRSGVIESTDTTLLKIAAEQQGPRKIIWSRDFEARLFESLRHFIFVLQALGVEPPLLVTLSMVDVRGYTMSRRGTQRMLSGGRPFDREVLMPQEVLIEDYAVDVPAAMKPVVDEIWNAADFKGSDFYQDGKWIGGTLSPESF
jgi:hypothetical protein